MREMVMDESADKYCKTWILGCLEFFEKFN